MPTQPNPARPAATPYTWTKVGSPRSDQWSSNTMLMLHAWAASRHVEPSERVRRVSSLDSRRRLARLCSRPRLGFCDDSHGITVIQQWLFFRRLLFRGVIHPRQCRSQPLIHVAVGPGAEQRAQKIKERDERAFACHPSLVPDSPRPIVGKRHSMPPAIGSRIHLWNWGFWCFTTE